MDELQLRKIEHIRNALNDMYDKPVSAKFEEEVEKTQS